VTESGIRTAIYNLLAAVTDIGKVYDYERWAADWATFINLFKTTISGTPQIRGWEIGRRAVKEDNMPVRSHIYVIRGYMGINDAAATEKTFNALIEAIAAKFRDGQPLSGAALGHDFIQAELIDARMFGAVLCHYCELSLTVYEDKDEL
jgi:hypothetical protein